MVRSIRKHVCMYVCMHLCVCMHVCMYVCMYLCVRTYLCLSKGVTCVCMFLADLLVASIVGFIYVGPLFTHAHMYVLMLVN